MRRDWFKACKKNCPVIDLAIENKVPIIGINDSGGAKFKGVNSLAGYGEIFFKNSKASGYIPQISIDWGLVQEVLCIHLNH